MSNHLAGQASFYLRSQAQDPVDWYPWCQEAFRRARKEKKPIFLFIGYNTCHWCQLMQGLVFRNREIAQLLNRDFIAILVDQEEQPEIDRRYRLLCSPFREIWSWPASIFLTPEGCPFYAGGYFTPETDRGLPGFKDVLRIIGSTWSRNPEILTRCAESVRAQACLKQ